MSTEPITAAPAARPRRRGLRLQALMALVLLVAAALAGWAEHRRQSAVAALLAAVSKGVLISIRPTRPSRDPTASISQAPFLAPLGRIRALHAERPAADALAAALADARARRDEDSVSGATAALLWIGPRARSALPELIRTAESPESALARCLAVHAIPVVGEDDPAALSALVRLLRATDETGQDFVAASAASELGGLGPRAKAAIPSLAQALEQDRVPEQGKPRSLLPGAVVEAIGLIGPDARSAVPLVRARLVDSDPMVRGLAAWSLGGLAAERSPGEPEAADLRARLRPALEPLRDDPDGWVRLIATQTLGQFRYLEEVRLRREDRLRRIAADRLRAAGTR